MAWGKFDDAYPHHPKLLAAGPEGLALDVAAVCYANRYGTDGFVPAEMLPALYPPIKSPRRVADKLVSVGRWEPVDGGWMIHDFTDYNPTSVEAEDKRRKRAEAGRLGGRRSKPPSKREANASAGASDGGEANGNPDPYPKEEPDGSSPRRRRKPDPIFDALIDVCGLDPAQLTRSARGRVNSAAKELRDIGASAEGIRARAGEYRKRWPTIDLTPTGLSANYALLGAHGSSNGAAPDPVAAARSLGALLGRAEQMDEDSVESRARSSWPDNPSAVEACLAAYREAVS